MVPELYIEVLDPSTYNISWIRYIPSTHPLSSAEYEVGSLRVTGTYVIYGFGG